ncbi:GNAT family N-acetyltransferase [Pleionea sediminis]|uniref:GNAT family N-acetyltransferase n=1 Tax=Pleionea sediminis TaxID=2569479 RepID=UPI001185872B|nr:GNAT family N-acetyltransferase [Pleionea sediminis]
MALLFETPRLKIIEINGSLSNSEREYLLKQIPLILSSSVVESLPPYFHSINSQEAAEVWLDRMLSKSRLFLVKLANGELVGFLFAYVENGRDAHIGYLLSEKYWGRGLASELLRGFIDEVTEEEAWVKLIAGVESSNMASVSLLKKLGFVEQVASEEGVVFYEYSLREPSE